MKKIILVFSVFAMFFCMAPVKGNSQIINGAYKTQDVFQRKPMILPTAREADIFWSKTIWRIIDLREKINQPLYFPTTEIEGRVNLISLLMQGIESGQLTAYDARNDDDFQLPITYAEAKEQFGAKTEIIEKINFETGEKDTTELVGEYRVEEIKRIMLKEMWYFDKQTSTMNVRIIGLCPIREFIREDDPTNTIQRTQLFWIYYPEAREMLAVNEVFNPYNDARKMTFDDLFIKRYFKSYVTQVSNTFNNRAISQFLSGKEALLESNRIEKEIFDFEQNLWEY